MLCTVWINQPGEINRGVYVYNYGSRVLFYTIIGTKNHITYYAFLFLIINRPGVAKAVLQTPSLLIDWVID